MAEEQAGQLTITPAMEDCLRTILLLSQSETDVRPAQIAERLGVSRPSATVMIERLQRNRLVRHRPYGAVALTERGEVAARALLNRRALLERFLVEQIGLPANAARAEAETLEHALSPKLEARIRLLVDGVMSGSGVLGMGT